LTYFLEFGSDASHLFLQFADVAGVGSLGSDEGILYAFEAVGHLQYMLSVGVNEGDHIIAASNILRGTTGVGTFLRHAGRLGCMQRSETPEGHV
jgi:hypothetical protein